MKLLQIFFILAIFCGCGSFAHSQAKLSQETTKAIKGSPAYAELLLRKAELESDVESFLVSYTEEYPKLKEVRFELDLINKDLAKLLTQSDASRLTLALGKLMLRKNEIETSLWALKNQYGNEHPEVKRAQRKVLSFTNAIKEILL